MLRVSPIMSIGYHMPKQQLQQIEHSKSKQNSVESFQDLLTKAMANKNSR